MGGEGDQIDSALALGIKGCRSGGAGAVCCRGGINGSGRDGEGEGGEEGSGDDGKGELGGDNGGGGWGVANVGQASWPVSIRLDRRCL